MLVRYRLTARMDVGVLCLRRFGEQALNVVTGRWLEGGPTGANGRERGLEGSGV